MSLLLAECLRVTLTTTGGVLKFFQMRKSCVVIFICCILCNGLLWSLHYCTNVYICILYFIIQIVRCIYTVVGIVREFRQFSHLYVYVCFYIWRNYVLRCTV